MPYFPLYVKHDPISGRVLILTNIFNIYWYFSFEKKEEEIEEDCLTKILRKRKMLAKIVSYINYSEFNTIFL